MQRGRGGMGNFFGFNDPFAGFGGFSHPGSLISSLLDGRDPFDDPFFTNPFESMFGNVSGSSLFGGSSLRSLRPSFGHVENARFLEDQGPSKKKQRGPIIHEIISDGEEEEKEEVRRDKDEGNRKHLRSEKEPYVQLPDDIVDGKRKRQINYTNHTSNTCLSQPQSHTYSFQSTKVTYGGPNGAYYTSSTTRKTGGDGVTFEESKEADTITGKATHRVSRGLHDKGHSVTRKLNSDGIVDTMQTLHNLNEDELNVFEKDWAGNAEKHLPGWSRGLGMLESSNEGNHGSSSGRSVAHRLALPYAEQQHVQLQFPNSRKGVPRARISGPSNK